jgi:hypothetical protein
MARVFIANICLAYLLQFDQEDGASSTTVSSYPLSGYAAKNWMDHAGSDPAGDLDELHRLVMTLLESTSAVYVNWMWLYHQSDPWAESGKNPLYITAETGLERAVQNLLQNRIRRECTVGVLWHATAGGGFTG